jgi:NosR/NirI family nitrous oxide reductase transcriptional regulator
MSQTIPITAVETPKRKPTRKPFTRHDWIRLGILLWFVACWFIGSMRGQVDLDPFFELAYPDAAQVVKVTDELHRAEAPDGTVLGYVSIGVASAYGGPLTLAVAVDPMGAVSGVSVVRHRETPSFFGRVMRTKFLEQLVNQTYRDEIVLGEDVDGVSGATYTSLGLTQSVHRAVRAVAQGPLDLPVPQDERRIVFGVPELVLIALFGLGVAQRQIRMRKKLRNRLRWATLLTGLVVLGFMYNRPFVLAHVNMVLLGYWPEWQTHLYWYILIIGLLLFKAKDQWNLYCYDFCPFGAAQDVLGLIGGAKSRKVRWSDSLIWAKRWLIAAAISLALIYRNPGFSSYEIFGTMFRLEGSMFQFALLAIIVFAAMFYSRPWCQFLCPLHRHGTEGLFDWGRKQVLNQWQKLRPVKAS